MTVEEGNDKLIRFFEAMHTDLLALHRRHDIEYIPHIGLGYFRAAAYDLTGRRVPPLDEARYEKTLRQAKAANLDFESQLDRLTLVKLNDQFSSALVC